jgi:hypothetical protein
MGGGVFGGVERSEGGGTTTERSETTAYQETESPESPSGCWPLSFLSVRVPDQALPSCWRLGGGGDVIIWRVCVQARAGEGDRGGDPHGGSHQGQ